MIPMDVLKCNSSGRPSGNSSQHGIDDPFTVLQSYDFPCRKVQGITKGWSRYPTSPGK